MSESPRTVLLTMLVVIASLRSGAALRAAENDANPVRLGTPVENDQASAKTSVNALAFSEDGSVLLTGKAGGTLEIWDVVTGKSRAAVKAHDDDITVIIRRGDKFFTASSDATIKEWDATGKALRTLPKLPGGIEAMAISNDGKKLAVGLNALAPSLFILDANSGRPTQKIKGPRTTGQLSFAPDNLTLLVAGHEVLELWNLVASQRTWQRGKEPKEGEIILDAPFFSGCAFSPDKLTAGASIDRDMGAIIQLWDAKTGKNFTKIATRSWHVHFTFSPDGKRIAMGGSKPELVVYTTQTGEPAKDFGDPGGRVTCIAFSPDGKRLATGLMNGASAIWDTSAISGK